MQQRKISEWLSALPEPYRSEALENFRKQGWKDKEVENAEAAINCSFDWSATPQKHNYWYEVFVLIDNEDMQISKFPAPVNTWIPVEELGNYAKIQKRNVIGWYSTDWYAATYDNEKDIYHNYMIGSTPTHIMIINPPNQ